MNDKKPLHTYRKFIKPVLVIVNKRITFKRYIRHFRLVIKAKRLGHRNKYAAKFNKTDSIRTRTNIVNECGD